MPRRPALSSRISRGEEEERGLRSSLLPSFLPSFLSSIDALLETLRDSSSANSFLNDNDTLSFEFPSSETRIGNGNIPNRNPRYVLLVPRGWISFQTPIETAPEVIANTLAAHRGKRYTEKTRGGEKERERGASDEARMTVNRNASRMRHALRLTVILASTLAPPSHLRICAIRFLLSSLEKRNVIISLDTPVDETFRNKLYVEDIGRGMGKRDGEILYIRNYRSKFRIRWKIQQEGYKKGKPPPTPRRLSDN